MMEQLEGYRVLDNEKKEKRKRKQEEASEKMKKAEAEQKHQQGQDDDDREVEDEEDGYGEDGVDGEGAEPFDVLKYVSDLNMTFLGEYLEMSQIYRNMFLDPSNIPISVRYVFPILDVSLSLSSLSLSLSLSLSPYDFRLHSILLLFWFRWTIL